MTSSGQAAAPQTSADPEVRFEFGRNWERFIERHLGQERIESSKRILLNFLALPDLAGKSFLDIGSGSGLHSLAAHQAGAREIFSFDYDPQSVSATLLARRFAGDPPSWRAVRGSILDDAFVRTLPRADIVYSWGVLHHTGDVWRAIQNAASCVPEGGQFYIALYSADVHHGTKFGEKPTPEFWLDVKRRYNESSWLGRQRWVLWYLWRFEMGRRLRYLPTVLKQIFDRRRRGMSYLTDVRDWVGGWPMEFVHDRDAIRFCEERGFVLERVKTGEACSEFLFRRPAVTSTEPPRTPAAAV